MGEEVLNPSNDALGVLKVHDGGVTAGQPQCLGQGVDALRDLLVAPERERLGRAPAPRQETKRPEEDGQSTSILLSRGAAKSIPRFTSPPMATAGRPISRGSQMSI